MTAKMGRNFDPSGNFFTGSGNRHLGIMRVRGVSLLVLINTTHWGEPKAKAELALRAEKGKKDNGAKAAGWTRGARPGTPGATP